jgi:hypothetical protein
MSNEKTDLTCCGPIRKGKKDEDGKTIFAYWCDNCGRIGTGSTPGDAAVAFAAEGPSQNLPARPEDLQRYLTAHRAEMTAIAAPFLAKTPAFDRMVKMNLKYVTQNKDEKFMKVWNSPEGRESIIDALEEAFSLGATLPAMGSIVEFIPSVEAYEFALTTGKNAPFTDVRIDPIHKNDTYECGEDENENFNFRFTSVVAQRGEIIGIVVRATTRSGRKIGNIYDVNRLIEKAKAHSKGYQNYLRDKLAFETAKTEGRVKTKDGREYVEKLIEYTKNGQKRSFTKEIFADQITNPYDGADRPEMLRKSAGKSFFAPYIKVRNSTAAMDELRENAEQQGPGAERTVEGMVDDAINRGFEAFEEEAGKQQAPPPKQPPMEEPEDAEIVEDEPDFGGEEDPEPEKSAEEEKKPEKGKIDENELF